MNLAFNNQPVTEADARKLIVQIYGERRVEEILKGLEDGKYSCASVAGGHLTVVKEPVAETADQSDKAAPKKK